MMNGMVGGIVQVERLIGDVRAQVITCPCGCWRRYAIATIEPEDRWVTMDVLDDAAVYPTMLRIMELFADPENLYGLSHALTMVGTAREVLMRPGLALMQYRLMEGSPEWLLGVPIEYVEEIRGLVFGHDITKTISAIQAIGAVTSAKDCQRPPVGNVDQLRAVLAPMVVERWGSRQ